MPELERELQALAGAVEFPATPDLGTRIHAVLPGRPRRVWPVRIAVVLAAVVAALGVALAVPKARSAILRFFDIGTVRIEFVDRLPQVRPSAPLALGRRIDARRAPFRLLYSHLLGKPDAVYREGAAITQLYGSPGRVRLLVTQIRTGFDPSVGKKLQSQGTSVQFVPIHGSTGVGVWIEGRPHIVVLPGGAPRLAADTLVWERDGTTVRLEGAPRLEDAIAIAESLR